MDTFTLTMDQIKAIYAAGIRRGKDLQFEWGNYGSVPTGNEYDELAEALYYDVFDRTKDYAEIRFMIEGI